MATSFDPRESIVRVAPVRITGPKCSLDLTLFLDTGATHTMIDPGALAAVGYTVANLGRSTKLITVDGEVERPFVRVQSLSALDQSRAPLPVIAHRIDKQGKLGVSGLLGLDFLRRRRLLIDFRSGTIVLRSSR
jgi:predicted aspartyl protease